MAGTDGTVRVAVEGDDAYLEAQVRRVAAAAGAVVVGPGGDGCDLLVRVGDERAGVGPGGGPGGAPVGVPWVRVRADAAVGADRRAARRDPPATADVKGAGELIRLPRDAEALLRLLGTLACRPRARTVVVVGARGGVGASTLAAALARAAAGTGLSTALVDLEAAGAGLDLLLGLEHEPGPRWADLEPERAGFPAEALSRALPPWCGVRVLSGDLRGGAAGGTVLDDAVRALRSAHDVVVLDAPRARWPSDAGLGLGDVAADVHVLVAAGDVRSAAALAGMRARRPAADLRLAVRAGGVGGLHPEELAQVAEAPLAVVLRTERGAAAAAEVGGAPGDNRRGAVARAAGRLAAAVLGER